MENKEPDNFLVVEMKSHVMPSFNYSSNKDWVEYGKLNNYPGYLIELYNRNPIHGTIVKGKSDYVYGKGLSYDKDNTTILQGAKIQSFLDNANRFETWNDVYKKTARDYELFNGWAWQIIWDKSKISEVYRLEFAKLRRSKCGKFVYYCDCWAREIDGRIEPNNNPKQDDSFKKFDLFNPSIRTGTQVFYYRKEEPSADKYGKLYPIPEYSGAIADIETDIEITNFHFHNLKNGMFASALLSFFNGTPTPEQEKKIKKMFNFTHTGTMNTGKVLISFQDKGGTAPTLQTLTPSDLDKQFEQLGKRLQQNIFSAHRAHPVLFGIMTEGSLSDTGSAAILTKWDQMERSYTEARRNTIISEIKMIAEVNGDDLPITGIPMSPVGAELPTDPNVLALFNDATKRKYFADKYNVEIVEEEIEGQSMSALPVNDNIRNLTGRQMQRLQSIISKYKSGKLSYEEAVIFINGFGLGDDYVTQVLGQKFNRQIDVISLFEKFAIDDNTEDTFVSEKFIHSEEDAKEFELRQVKFATEEQIQSQIKDLYKGDQAMNPEKAAKILGLTTDQILQGLSALIIGGYIIEQAGLFQPTQKTLDEKIKPVKTETYTVYEYVTRPDVPEAESSREFCKKLLKMSRNGKRWTREAIQKITNEIGESAWSYRGGFYTNPNTQETTPYCRHIWKGIVKTRIKK